LRIATSGSPSFPVGESLLRSKPQKNALTG
jgi:hypothetical protein